jgi:toxin-antitoxin system PIN domain toxin
MQVVDANVLLYAVNERAAHHQAAKRWLDSALAGRETVAFTWNVLLAFVRLSTHPRVFPTPLEPGDALEIVEVWLGQPTAVVVEPGDRHLRVLASLLAEVGVGGNLVGDAHLAAIAIERGAEVVSFDTDFARFGGLRRVDPRDA